ncbi:MAG: endonuclease III [bacterium]|nr:endonuclease III [bacterium]
MTPKNKAKKILEELSLMYPRSVTILNWHGDWQLLVAVMLSAQTTDIKVNEVTTVLFSTYSSAKALSNANVLDIEKIIRPVNYYKTKAWHVKATMQKICTEYGGHVPHTMHELLTLPGVGRKTANVVLGNLFDIQEGIAVDTHVQRLVRLWGLSQHRDPKRIERDLLKLVPEKERHLFTNRCINYGREHCNARCVHAVCPLRGFVD